MDFVALLNELARRRITVSTTSEGKISITGPPRSIDSELGAALRQHKVLLQWTAAAALSGHEWRVCTNCHAFRLATPGRTIPCNLTSRCEGRLVPTTERGPDA